MLSLLMPSCFAHKSDAGYANNNTKNHSIRCDISKGHARRSNGFMFGSSCHFVVKGALTDTQQHYTRLVLRSGRSLIACRCGLGCCVCSHANLHKSGGVGKRHTGTCFAQMPSTICAGMHSKNHALTSNNFKFLACMVVTNGLVHRQSACLQACD